jgi:hypothetical protein
MRVFELGTDLGSDKCAMVNKEFVNRSINDYNLYNMYFTSDCTGDNSKMSQFVSDNPNLRYKDGFGFTNSCVVDMDSALRNDSRLTHDKTKIQLCTRWNKAVPDLGKGGLIPNIESRLKNSEDTSVIRVCDRVAEKDFDRYTPLVGCVAPTIQNPEHIILPFTRGGDITRNYIFSNNYLEKCGFKLSPHGNFYEKVGQKQWAPLVQGKQPTQQAATPGVSSRPVATQ